MRNRQLCTQREREREAVCVNIQSRCPYITTYIPTRYLGRYVYNIGQKAPNAEKHEASCTRISRGDSPRCLLLTNPSRQVPMSGISNLDLQVTRMEIQRENEGSPCRSFCTYLHDIYAPSDNHLPRYILYAHAYLPTKVPIYIQHLYLHIPYSHIQTRQLKGSHYSWMSSINYHRSYIVT